MQFYRRRKSVINWPQQDRDTKWSFLHSSAHVSSRSGRSHFFPSSVDLAFLWSSSVRYTSAWTMVRLSAAGPFDHCWKWDIPTPCRPVFVFPMMFLYWSHYVPNFRQNTKELPIKCVTQSKELLFQQNSFQNRRIESVIKRLKRSKVSDRTQILFFIYVWKICSRCVVNPSPPVTTLEILL